ncbi:hypothetical protein [Photorhabdus viridis]|uniref:hypothetical protein n=1 Tax=Photorhabdus viridis TaxID=3163327 RepID=UPI003306ED28
MKKFLKLTLVSTLVATSFSSFSSFAGWTDGKVQFGVYGGQELRKVDGDSDYPSRTAPSETTSGVISIGGQSSSYSTSVTYETKDGQHRCRFTAGYYSNNYGPVYTSKGEPLTPGTDCSISLSGEKYGKPYGFAMNIAIYR